MEKRAVIILLSMFVIILFSFKIAAACPVGQMANFDGSCIGDPNYNAGAVSCASLMASSGKSAETLCKVNYAGQCCNQATGSDTTEDTTTTPDTTTSASDYTYPSVDCSKDSYSDCEVHNQYSALYNEIYKKINYDNAEAMKLLEDEQQAEDDYYYNVYLPKDNELQATFDACIATKAGTCYDAWEAPWEVNNLAEANYRLNLLKKLNQDLDALPSSGNNNNPPEAGITNPGSDNPDYNRGRDSQGRMTPSIGGYLGDAYVMRADGTKVIPGHELYLKVDDSIVSGQKSNVNIIFSNAGSMNLGPDTVMRVGNALLDQYYLAKGTFKSKINLQKVQKFEIDTPNAAIFVRGTEYIVDYNETTNTTTIYLNEGVLEINIKNKVMNLTAGNYLIIYSNGTTKTNQLESENWNNLGNNFYEPVDSEKIFKYLMIAFFIIDLAAIVILAVWMSIKIKNPNKKDKSTSRGTASLVLGIIGIVILLAPYVGIILSALAFSLSRIQKANKPTRTATAGMVLGIIGLVLNAIILVAMCF